MPGTLPVGVWKPLLTVVQLKFGLSESMKKIPNYDRRRSGMDTGSSRPEAGLG